MNKEENILNLSNAIDRITNKENNVYFLTYDTKNNPRAAIKYIYDLAYVLKTQGYKSNILVESKDYTGVSHWLTDEKYKEIPILVINENDVKIGVDDIMVIPEYYSNVLQQLSNVRCTKIMLVQQKDYIFETLPVGSVWKDFGIDRVITTTNSTKEYIQEYFPNVLVHVIPPIIGDNFSKTTKNKKPYIAISCRDRVAHRRIISEFYIKNPHLRWITFRDMVQMTYDEFSEALKECLVSVWIDDESTFGTFPIESMKCGVPIIGKIPNTEPDWLGENGFWTYDVNKISETVGTYVEAWLEGIETADELIQNMNNTVLQYDTEITKNNIISIFNSFNNKRIEVIEKALEKIKEEIE